MNMHLKSTDAVTTTYSDCEALVNGSFLCLRPNPRRFKKALCRLLERHFVRYCLIGGSESEPSLCDLAVHPADRERFQKVFEPLRHEGYVVVQCVELTIEHFHFYFAYVLEPQVRFLSINVVYEYPSVDLKWMSTANLVHKRVRCGDYWGLSIQEEFVYWLGRCSTRETSEQYPTQRLKELVEELGYEEAAQSVARVYSDERKLAIVRACTDGTIATFLHSCRDPWRRELLKQNPKRALKGVLRLIRQWLQPNGLFLALLGPDGVGKSTITAHIKKELATLFPDQCEFHWRPQFLMPRPQDPRSGDRNGRLQEMFSQNRHGDPPRGALISTMRLLGVMLDYWMGYFREIRYRLTRSGLVVFDRYYHDILVDSVRYRYGGSKWILRALQYALPPWRVLFLILDADEQIVYSRKQELTLNEIQYQRTEYRKLSLRLPAAVLIRTDTGLEACRNQALRAIVEHLGARFINMFRY